MEGPVGGARELAALLDAPLVTEGDAADAVRGGARTLVAEECTIAITALPAAAARHPGLRVAWLDAHPDFNTPETSPSGYRGGMPLAAACGLWDAGGAREAPVDPARVHLLGIRDVDPGERENLERAGVRETPPPEGPVWVHLDLDVLDPLLMPARYPVAGGWSWEDLEAALAALPRVVGVEVAGCAAGHAPRAAEALRVLEA